VSPSTASTHLARLKEQNLVAVMACGKHRYYRLEGPSVAAVIEALVAGRPRTRKIFRRNPQGAIIGYVDRREGEDVVWTRVSGQGVH
jgi:DNA-binding transcriptional ArsR family regulator